MASKYKQLALALTIILVNFFGWNSIKASMGQDIAFAGAGKLTIIFLISFGILYSLTSLLIKKRKNFIILAIILSLLPFAFFEKNVYLLCAGLILFLALFFGGQRIRKEKKKNIKFSFWEVNRRGISLCLTGLAVMIAVIFAFSPTAYRLKVEIPRSFTETIFGLSEDMIVRKFPGYYQNMKIDEFLSMIFIEQLNAASSDTSYLSESVIKQKKAEYLQTQKENLSESLGVEIRDGESIKDIFHLLINMQFWKYNQNYPGYIPIVLIFIGFTVIKSLALFLKPIIIFSGWVLFKILTAFRFIVIKKKIVKKEIVTI